MAVNSPKYRDYFITINQGCEAYNNVEAIISELNYTLYALITHDKDFTINSETGEQQLKAKHKHLIIELKNPISFNSITNKFKGAHIETPKYKKSAYQYLIHNSPNSHDKYQYELTEIITNNIEQVKQIIESETFELFYENQFLRYIAQGTRTYYQFTKRFGLNATRQYWDVYSKLLINLNSDFEMQQDLKEMKQIIEEEDLPF